MARFRGYICDICGKTVDSKETKTLSCFDSDGVIVRIDENEPVGTKNRFRYDICDMCWPFFKVKIMEEIISERSGIIDEQMGIDSGEEEKE